MPLSTGLQRLRPTALDGNLVEHPGDIDNLALTCDAEPVVPEAPRASTARRKGVIMGFFWQAATSPAAGLPLEEGSTSSTRPRPAALSPGYDDDSAEEPLLPSAPKASSATGLRRCFGCEPDVSSPASCGAAVEVSDLGLLTAGGLLRRQRPLALDDEEELRDIMDVLAPAAPEVPAAPRAATRRTAMLLAGVPGLNCRPRPTVLDDDCVGDSSVESLALDVDVPPAAPRHATSVDARGGLLLRSAPESLNLEDIEKIDSNAILDVPPPVPCARSAGLLHSLSAAAITAAAPGVDTVAPVHPQAPRCRAEEAFLQKPSPSFLRVDGCPMPPASPRVMPPSSPRGRLASPRARPAGLGLTISKPLLMPPPTMRSVIAAAPAPFVDVQQLSAGSRKRCGSWQPPVSAMSLDLRQDAGDRDDLNKPMSARPAAEGGAREEEAHRFLSLTRDEWGANCSGGKGSVPFSAAPDISRMLPPIAAKRSLTPSTRTKTCVLPTSARSAAADWRVM